MATAAYELQEAAERAVKRLKSLDIARLGQDEVGMGVFLVNNYWRPRLAETWGKDDGAVLWWTLPVCEPPWAGTPLCEDWPGDDIFTHWTPIPLPLTD